MEYKDLASKKVAVLGVGIEGVALAEFLLDKCMEITLLDQKSDSEIQDYLSQNQGQRLMSFIDDGRIKTVFGDGYLANLGSFDMVFRSPGIKYLTKEIQEALKAGVGISSQIKLFFDLCPCPIIGVTGTKGKGTTATLISSILQKFQDTRNKSQTNSKSQIPNINQSTDSLINPSANIYLAGNIGTPAISLIGKIKSNDVVILELSSFQLQDLHKSPHVAIVLNISSDHLNYHQSEVEYHEAKLPVVKYQGENDIAIVNMDYFASFEFASQTTARVFYFSGKDSVDQGAFIRKATSTDLVHRKDTEVNNEAIEQPVPRSSESEVGWGNKDVEEVVLRVDGKDEVICRSDEIELVGHHNLENIAAAGLAAYLCGADIYSIREAVKRFKGLPHRLEFVAGISGVKVYNDSFATNPEPAIAAVKAFAGPKLLILGGSSKGADFDDLAQEISKSEVRAIALIGDESEYIKSSLEKYFYNGTIIEAGYDFNKAINDIWQVSKSGDVLILSPACASFDMFKNYKDRGERFKSAVGELR